MLCIRGTTKSLPTKYRPQRRKLRRVSQTVRARLSRTPSIPLSRESSKAAANVLAVDERQSHESLNREEKIASRTLTRLKEKEQEFEERKVQREEELRSLNTKWQEVRPCARWRPLDSFLW